VLEMGLEGHSFKGSRSGNGEILLKQM
jgi:hypothetical protein